MQNQNTRFDTLLKHVWSTLGQSENNLKEKYKDYPICIMEYIDKEIHEHIIEVRFDNEEATISISFDNANKCDASFLFFDSTEDESSLIDHLVNSADYDFRKGCFRLPSCSLKIKETKTETCFYLFR